MTTGKVHLTKKPLRPPRNRTAVRRYRGFVLYPLRQCAARSILNTHLPAIPRRQHLSPQSAKQDTPDLSLWMPFHAAPFKILDKIGLSIIAIDLDTFFANGVAMPYQTTHTLPVGLELPAQGMPRLREIRDSSIVWSQGETAALAQRGVGQ